MSCDPKQQKRVALGVTATVAVVSLIILAIFWAYFVQSINCGDALSADSTCGFACVSSAASPAGTQQCAWCPTKQGTAQSNCAWDSARGYAYASGFDCDTLTGNLLSGEEQCNLCVFGTLTPTVSSVACANLKGSSNVQKALGYDVGLGVGIAFTILFFISVAACVGVMLFGCRGDHESDGRPGVIIASRPVQGGNVYKLTMGLDAPATTVPVQPPNPYASS